MIYMKGLVKTKMILRNARGEGHGDIVGASGKGCRFNSPRLDFDRRLMLQFRCCPIASWMTRWATSDTGGDVLAGARTGKNGRHQLVGLLRGWPATRT